MVLDRLLKVIPSGLTSWLVTETAVTPPELMTLLGLVIATGAAPSWTETAPLDVIGPVSRISPLSWSAMLTAKTPPVTLPIEPP